MRFLILIALTLCLNVNAKIKKADALIEHFMSKENIELKMNDAFTKKIQQLDLLAAKANMEYGEYLTSTEFLKISQNAVDDLYLKVEVAQLNQEKSTISIDTRIVEYLSEVSYFLIFLDAHVGSFLNSTFKEEGILKDGEYEQIYKSTQKKIFKMMWLLLEEDGSTQDLGLNSLEELYEEYGIE